MTPETTNHHFTRLEIAEAYRHNYGYCMSCRALRDSCEPDAKDYRCEECGEAAVYGPHWIEIIAPFESEV